MEEEIVQVKEIENKNSNTMESSIKLSNFHFRYERNGPTILSNINLEILKGETIFIGGISGSGKTTLLNAISGQIPHKIKGQMKGSIEFFSRDIWSYSHEELSLEFGYLFQNADSQLISFTVFDEIAFAAENICLPEAEIRKRIIEISEVLNIGHLLERSIFSLSGGEKQKIILAANLITNPKVLILDEPLAFLDIKGEKSLINFLKAIKGQNEDLITVIVEHRLTPFRDMVDRILLLSENGHIDFIGTMDGYGTFVKRKNKLYLRDIGKFEDYEDLINHHEKNNSNYTKNQENLNKNLVSMNNIDFHYPNSPNILEDFSLEINEGEFLGIVGENGSGKTTLLYLLARILDPSLGTITYDGQNYNEMNRGEFYSGIGFIFQNPENQIFESTVESEILFGPRNLLFKGISGNEEEESTILGDFIPLINGGKNVEKDPEQDSKNKNNSNSSEINNLNGSITGNGNIRERNPFKLSWGQKRRLNLASILSYNADLLLIDEPFIGQDADSIKRIFDILHDFNGKGKTIVIVSHDVDLLSSNCSRLFHLNKFNSDTSKTSKENVIIKDAGRASSSQKKEKYSTSKGSHSPRKEREINRLVSNFGIEPEDSWLSRMNPLPKLFGLFLITLVLFLQKSILVYSIFFISLFILGKTAKIEPYQLFRKARFVFIMTFAYIPLNTLFDASISRGDFVLFYLFGIETLPVRRLALYFAMRNGLLIMSLFTMAIIFNHTTSLKRLVYSLMQIGLPYRYAFSFIIGLRYIPIIQNESQTIEIAQRLRGFGVKKGTSVKKIFHHIVQRITTLLIIVFRKSHTTSLAIEARCFGVYKKRTNLYEVEWKKTDLIWSMVFIAFGVFGILYGLNAFPQLIFPSIYSVLKYYGFFI